MTDPISLPRSTLEKIQQFLLEEGLKASDPERAKEINRLWEEVGEAMK